MADERPKSIGESTPVTVGLMIAIVSAACAVAIDHGSIRDLDRRVSQTEAVQARAADDRLALERRLSSIEGDVRATREAVEQLLQLGGIVPASRRVPR